MGRFVQLFRLALADLRHDGAIALCQIVALAAVLAPLLVLAGLERGVIGTMIERLDHDPAMRLIQPEAIGVNRFDAAWFAVMRARPDVAFVIPNTRAIAGQVDMLPADGLAGAPLRLSWLPTAPGDPAAAPGQVLAPTARDIGLSAAAARRLGVKVGDLVLANIERERGGRVEAVNLRLTVTGIAPADHYEGLAAFVVLPLLEAVQDFRDGMEVPYLDADGDMPRRPPLAYYPLFRLYAASITDVGPLADQLTADGVNVTTRVAEIAAAMGLRRNLMAILIIIAVLAGAGYLLSLGANQYAAVARKRHDLAVLALVGYGRGWMIGLPVLQAIVLAGLGIGLAFAFYAGAAAAIDSYFSAGLAEGEAACRLVSGDAALAAAATLGLTILPALLAGWLYGGVDPARELHRA